MSNDRLLNLIKLAIQRSLANNDQHLVSQQLNALVQVERERRIELEKECAILRLKLKYAERLS